MLKLLWRLLMWGTEDSPEPPKETFGGASLDSSLGLAILSDPKRQYLCQSIRDLMLGIPREERGDYVDRLLLRFALFVVDLQASEQHHNARPYGLLDHSLEVACQVAYKVGRPVFRVSEDPAEQYREHPRWQYAAMVCALLHDVGKVLDLDVATPDGKDRWDPHAEPLAQFCARNGLKETGPRFWSYRTGRGLRFHAWHGPMVFPLVLTPKITAYLGHRLALLSDAMIAETLDRAPEATHPVAARVAKVIHDADIEASKADRQSVAPAVTDVVAARTPAPQAPAEAVSPEPDPAPVEDEPFVIPIKCPPLDLGVVLKDFSDALRAAVEQGILPLNKEGGLIIGRKHVYLHFPDGFDRVIDLMVERGSDLEDRFEEDRAAISDPRHEITPRDRVFQALLAGKRLPYSSDTMLWVQQGTVVHPGGETFEGQLVLMNMPFPDFPRFRGKLELYGIGDPEGESPRNPLAPPPEPPPAPVLRRDPEEAFGLRLDAELEPARLLSTLLGALRARVFHRPGSWSPVLVRPDFTWVLVPEAFKVLLPRIGIPFSAEVENRILRSLEEMPELARGSKGRVLHRIKVHPESADLAWALAIDTARVEEGPDRRVLPAWPCPVRVIDDVPGEYAA
ncbi:MAG TPA: TraI domain-containing protein [Planctomycetota bacterium]|jgi:hypothetical protein|nr:TraI domain-containing protein [Planctomycetota bacterium]